MAYDLSYILPLKKNLAFTFALTRAPRYNQVEYRSPTWNTVSGILAAYQNNELVPDVDIRTAKATVDWKIGQNSTVQVSYYDMDRRSLTRQVFTQFNPGANATGSPTFIQGAAMFVGTMAHNLSGNQQYRALEVISAKYKYDGPVWELDAFLFPVQTVERRSRIWMTGSLAPLPAARPTCSSCADGLDRIMDRGIPNLTATRAGVAVNPVRRLRLQHRLRHECGHRREEHGHEFWCECGARLRLQNPDPTQVRVLL